MANMNGDADPVSAEPMEDDDFDLNAEELATEDDQTPAVSAIEQDEESPDIETEDEDAPDDVRLCNVSYQLLALWQESGQLLVDPYDAKEPCGYDLID